MKRQLLHYSILTITQLCTFRLLHHIFFVIICLNIKREIQTYQRFIFLFKKSQYDSSATISMLKLGEKKPVFNIQAIPFKIYFSYIIPNNIIYYIITQFQIVIISAKQVFQCIIDYEHSNHKNPNYIKNYGFTDRPIEKLSNPQL